MALLIPRAKNPDFLVRNDNLAKFISQNIKALNLTALYSVLYKQRN